MVKVWGGMTGAGYKKGPKPAQTEPWVCANGHENKPVHRTCMTDGCHEWRPDAAPRRPE